VKRYGGLEHPLQRRYFERHLPRGYNLLKFNVKKQYGEFTMGALKLLYRDYQEAF